MIFVKVLVQGVKVFQGISVISVYALQCGLDDSQKVDFYDNLINVVRKLMEKEIVVIQETLMVTLEVIQKTMRTSMKVMVVELGTRKGKGFLSFCVPMNMTVGNSLFNKMASDTVTY